VNEEAMAHWGLLGHRKLKKENWIKIQGINVAKIRLTS